MRAPGREPERSGGTRPNSPFVLFGTGYAGLGHPPAEFDDRATNEPHAGSQGMTVADCYLVAEQVAYDRGCRLGTLLTKAIGGCR